MPTGREKKDMVSRMGRERGRKSLQISQKDCVTAGLKVSLSQTAQQIYATLGLTPGGWKVGTCFFRMSFYFNVGTRLRLNTEGV